MNPTKVCILGGSGFVGRRITSMLAGRGIRVATLTRHRDRNRDLLVRPEISVVECDVYDIGHLFAMSAGG